jgi:cellulose synthase/poly-beta-1,6-N-acetylglucosamine synthase-like glycosyltransferase
MTLIDFVLLLFAAKTVVFVYGAARSRAVKLGDSSLLHESVSVIIPARNEQDTLPNCLESLLKNTDTNCEFIIVNDRSTDGTQSVIDSYSAKDSRIKSVVLTEERKGNLRGKPGALHAGISAAKGEIILMSDADCTFPDNWIRTVGNAYADAKIGMIAGFTTINTRTSFHHFQDMEWLMNHTLASSSMSLGQPLGCFGNNLSIRKSVYDAIGGYKGIDFSVTEDLQLLTKVSNAGYGILYPCNHANAVSTEPCPDWKSFVSQQHRWVRGSSALGWKKYLFAFFAFVFWASLIFSIYVNDWAGMMSILAMRILGDCLIVIPSLNALNRMRHLPWIIPGMIFMIYMEIMVAFLLLKKDVHWKGQVFR